MVWTEFKDTGMVAFSQGDFDVALSSYQTALEELTSAERRDGFERSNDKQKLLSNVVACRLKIGGEEMATRAIEEAKQCVALDNRWPKAHIRLASAYIALGGRSNDACQSLQRAISLDRTNKVARDMLINEMRGRDSNGRSNGPCRSSSDGGNASSHAAPEPEEESSPETRPEQQSSSHSPNNRNGNDGIDIDDIDPPSSFSYESISERFQYYVTKSVTWYQNQSDDMQSLLKLLLVLLVLYVALGGRFGLEYVFQKQRRGNYDHGNAYDRYNSATRNSDRYGYASESSSSQGGNANRAERRTQGSGYNDRTNPRNDQYYSRYSHHDDERYYEPRQTRSNRRSTPNYLVWSWAEESFTTVVIVYAIVLGCYRFRVNPFQIFWLLQAMQRGGRHYNGYGGFGAAFVEEGWGGEGGGNKTR
eukprot:CAMPEP_0201727644 /NCGR_PEP_ID=MMETSP0593-20130828/13144_1 /ASSEMBLY_ACC=CAM_ASM_000672 /TAXON_ID=267983 /ORGANISM="Skeletonema japonicum, Strain CCMP2506" /LENGTH=418 /DNA_ID=CAMNT_0048219525 /DNA_START=64 /DNA_END=1318 /DNA_ORIENTATION=-